MESKKIEDIIVPIETAKIESFLCVEEKIEQHENDFWRFRFLVSLDNGIVGQYYSSETTQKMLKNGNTIEYMFNKYSGRITILKSE
jgi:hypothetical protein